LTLQIYIFAVRHARGGDSISIFSHQLGSDTVKLVKDVKHSGIKTANSVAAVGPL
jgi:arylesterase / paraoxonase